MLLIYIEYIVPGQEEKDYFISKTSYIEHAEEIYKNNLSKLNKQGCQILDSGIYSQIEQSYLI